MQQIHREVVIFIETFSRS